MKALLSTSSSLARCRLSRSSTRKFAAICSDGGNGSIAQSHDVVSNKLISSFHFHHPNWRQMGTTTEDQKDDDNNDVAVQAANER